MTSTWGYITHTVYYVERRVQGRLHSMLSAIEKGVLIVMY